MMKIYSCLKCRLGATRLMERTAMTCDAKGRILHIAVKILPSLFEKTNQAYRFILAKAV